ncbi:hypothetical protein [Streptomyces sp. NBC_01361]|uniref:hypothetical protein n=1 Tax=Streptomyces sp. NBC_01361 TaxID=2903838 RepID=UPI002E362500|nr:hypothetical protein [Streptomyces sp. NBC_01361]
MNELIMRDEVEPASAMLQMPQQNPPIDRTAAVAAHADTDAPGVEADFFPLLAGLASLLF